MLNLVHRRSIALISISTFLAMGTIWVIYAPIANYLIGVYMISYTGLPILGIMIRSHFALRQLITNFKQPKGFMHLYISISMFVGIATLGCVFLAVYFAY